MALPPDATRRLTFSSRRFEASASVDVALPPAYGGTIHVRRATDETTAGPTGSPPDDGSPGTTAATADGNASGAPGFGVLAALAGLGGTAYRAMRSGPPDATRSNDW